MKPINFQNFDLEMDYLVFNIPLCDRTQSQEIANYLKKDFQCTSTWKVGENGKQEDLAKSSRALCEAKFIYKQKQIKLTKERDYWDGTALRFPGHNSAKFYETIGSTPLDPNIFQISSMSLGRIDIKYDYTIAAKDSSVLSFLEESLHRQKNHRTGKLDRQKQKLIIYKRKDSPKFYRVYLREDGRTLRFELELKRNAAKAYQHAFFQRNFEEFERSLTSLFFQETFRIFGVNHPYLSWAKTPVRIVQPSVIEPLDAFSTSYITNRSMNDLTQLEEFYRTIQFLNFLKSTRYVRSRVAYTTLFHRTYKFKLYSFLEFLGYKKKNYYQYKKLLTFFALLEAKNAPFLSYFSHENFLSVSRFPVVLVRTQQKTTVVIIQIYEDILNYTFHLTPSLLIYNSKYQLKVNFLVIQAMAQDNLKKRIFTGDFFEELSLSNQKSSEVKIYFIKCLDSLQDMKIIEPGFNVTTKNGKVKRFSRLTKNLISRSKWIDFQERIQFKL